MSGAGQPDQRLHAGRQPLADKPAHYKVICISMYNEDLERLVDVAGQRSRIDGLPLCRDAADDGPRRCRIHARFDD